MRGQEVALRAAAAALVEQIKRVPP